MEIKVINIKGAESGKKVSLSDEVFNIEPNDHAIYLDVKRIQSAQRQGTHKSKQRNEVHGTTKKLKRQKGTGGARAGSKKSPLFIGGGRVFGPQPRDYAIKVNKKTQDLARKSVLSYKAKENNLFVVEDFNIDEPKTKNFESILSALKCNGNKTLFVIPGINRNIVLSSRNLPKAKVISADQINTYDLMNCEKLYLIEGSIQKIQEMLN